MNAVVFIPLTQGKVAVVDFEAFHVVRLHKWYALRKGHRWYARTNVPAAAGRGCLYLHQVVLGRRAADIDHKNGDGLDNRGENLRHRTHAENVRGHNHRRTNNTSGFRGVSWDQSHDRWQAYLHHDGKKLHLGYFSDLTAAVNARKLKAKEMNYE